MTTSLGVLMGQAMVQREDIDLTDQRECALAPDVPSDLAGNLPALRRYLHELRRLERRGGLGAEALHSRADDALLAYIGDARVSVSFERLERWYS